MSVNGKCHCGKVTWTAKLEFKTHILCHCNACKRINGSDYTCNQVIPKSDFELLQGELGEYTYTGDSGNPVHCYFCPNCTTHVYHHQTVMGDKIVLRTTTLEGAADWPVSAEIFNKDTVKWQPNIAKPESVFAAGPPSS